MLSKYGRDATSVFDLLGRNEVDLTASLGWTLTRSPALLKSVLHYLGLSIACDDVAIDLEVSSADGRTDIELTAPGAKVIIEAKQGWLLPGEEQLNRYSGRFRGFEMSLFVSLSESSTQWAATQLPKVVDGVPVRHIPWDAVRSLVQECRNGARLRERIWLEELEEYMGKATTTVPFDDQWVFCVVVSDTPFGDMTFREYVQKERVYFHPYGINGWPKVAPNFLCFRWDGQVQQVNRVAGFEVVASLTDRWPAVVDQESESAHFVYELGPDIPIPKVSTKGTYATGRVYCLLDQLLVHPTLAAAVSGSKALNSL